MIVISSCFVNIDIATVHCTFEWIIYDSSTHTKQQQLRNRSTFRRADWLAGIIGVGENKQFIVIYSSQLQMDYLPMSDLPCRFQFHSRGFPSIREYFNKRNGRHNDIPFLDHSPYRSHTKLSYYIDSIISCQTKHCNHKSTSILFDTSAHIQWIFNILLVFYADAKRPIMRKAHISFSRCNCVRLKKCYGRLILSL